MYSHKLSLKTREVLVSIRTLKGTQFQVTITMPGSQRTLLLDINVYNFEN